MSACQVGSVAHLLGAVTAGDDLYTLAATGQKTPDTAAQLCGGHFVSQRMRDDCNPARSCYPCYRVSCVGPFAIDKTGPSINQIFFHGLADVRSKSIFDKKTSIVGAGDHSAPHCSGSGLRISDTNFLYSITHDFGSLVANLSYLCQAVL